MSSRTTCSIAIAVALFSPLRQHARGQCALDWLPGEGAPGLVGSATVFAAMEFDPDGAGPAPPLAVFGGTMIGAGDVAVNSVAAWDGVEWRTLGTGLPAQVRAFTVYNGELIAAAGTSTWGGTGPANGVARFDGKQWHAIAPVGFGNVVWALTVFEGELIAGGLFNSAGGTPVNNIARWDGTVWKPMGAGLSNGVRALRVHNGELLAGGIGVHRWNGSGWEPFGPNLTGNVNVLATYGGNLVVGGAFKTEAGGPTHEVAQWNGTSWQALGGGMNDHVNTLLEYKGELIAGGLFTNVEGKSALRMARWNGATWSPIAPGPGIPVRRCDSLVVYGGTLYAGGAITLISGSQAEQVGRWDGQQWSYVGDGIDDVVYDLETYNGELIAAGLFFTAGDVVASGIARRDSAGVWHSMGGVSGEFAYVDNLTLYNGSLIASGSFTLVNGVPCSGVAAWDGVTWQAFGNTLVTKKLVHEGELYACGSFGLNQRVARWDPVLGDWQAIGIFPPNVGITAINIFEGDLIAAGIGGIGVNASVWRWDFESPGTWQPIGQHLGYTTIQTLGVFGGELLVGGNIDGGLNRFDGAKWVTLGGGLFLGNNSPSEILAVFDLHIHNGELVVAGAFSFAGDQQYSPNAVESPHVVRWNGSAWLPMGAATNNAAVTLHAHDGELLVGGWFDMAGGRPNGHLARWGLKNPGDVDDDGDVDQADLGVLLAHYGQAGSATLQEGDLDGDTDVDQGDLGILLAQYGTSCR